MGKRRETRYPVRFNVGLDAATAAKVRVASNPSNRSTWPRR